MESADLGRGGNMRTGGVVSESSFRTLDFDRLWKGRERTTEVERAVVGQLMEGTDPRRTLELGVGEGRLSGEIARASREYFGVDVVTDFLERLERSGRVPPGSTLVAANLYHLPFVAGSFSRVMMYRVYNFLEEPETALQEAGRVLTPGGQLFLAVQVQPSIGSLLDEVKAFLGNRRRTVSMTFSGLPRVPVSMSEVPCWQPTRRRLLEELGRSGFTLEALLPSGLEDYRVLRGLPPRVFLRISRGMGSAPGWPTLFLRARRAGKVPSQLPARGEIWACPSCRGPIADPSLGTGVLWRCPRCGDTGPIARGLVDARKSVKVRSP